MSVILFGSIKKRKNFLQEMKQIVCALLLIHRVMLTPVPSGNKVQGTMHRWNERSKREHFH